MEGSTAPRKQRGDRPREPHLDVAEGEVSGGHIEVYVGVVHPQVGGEGLAREVLGLGEAPSPQGYASELLQSGGPVHGLARQPGQEPLEGGLLQRQARKGTAMQTYLRVDGLKEDAKE